MYEPPQINTLQDIFDVVYEGIVKQGEPGKAPGSVACSYRHNGLKCAFGQLLPDDYYTPDLEDMNPQEIMRRPVPSNWSPALWCATQAVNLVADLLRAHDHSASTENFVASFKRRMHALADKLSLEIPDVNDCTDCPCGTWI